MEWSASRAHASAGSEWRSLDDRDVRRRGSGAGRKGRARKGRAGKGRAVKGGRGGPERPPVARRRPAAARARRPADRLSVFALVLSGVVGLSLLGIVERALLDGGPIASGDAAGARDRVRRPQAPPRPETPVTPRARPVRSGAPAPVARPDAQALTAQIRKLTLDERGGAAREAYGTAPAAAPLVTTTRTSADRTWAFGTTAIPVPDGSAATPEIALFAARWRGGRWQAGLSGGTAFGALLGAMPASLMSADERRVLRRFGAVTAEQAAAAVNGTRVGDGLVLPWRTGAAWAMGAAGEDAPRPLGNLSFWGGDGRVRAAGAGRMYRFCGDAAGRALVMVVHPSGVASVYYRLRSVPRLRDGGVVRRGAPLGTTGTDRPCGGAPSPRPEVEFDLRRGAEEVPLDGAVIGGWTFRERARPLLGYAERGDLQVLTGGLLANLGALPPADDSEDDPKKPETSPSAEPKPDDPAPSAKK
ncbi:peptidoglycan DD-metalloendopeptidase family protein [Spirillospora albida]|uniref:peptidoglycan DD-metalloendopeptidase family protein n=1 Tax=Spirillospora albida TaxID=58123 RepID=UPI00068A9813|nr:peptidoglycan DD-metalloendopeptidase family protein [Spirillospora albida]